MLFTKKKRLRFKIGPNATLFNKDKWYYSHVLSILIFITMYLYFSKISYF